MYRQILCFNITFLAGYGQMVSTRVCILLYLKEIVSLLCMLVQSKNLSKHTGYVESESEVGKLPQLDE